MGHFTVKKSDSQTENGVTHSMDNNVIQSAVNGYRVNLCKSCRNTMVNNIWIYPIVNHCVKVKSIFTLVNLCKSCYLLKSHGEIRGTLITGGSVGPSVHPTGCGDADPPLGHW